MDDPTNEYACTLDPSGARQRLSQARALTARLRRRERIDDRLVVTFDDDHGTVDLVEEFVRDESRCCSFFSFDVRRTDGAVILELSAPAQAGHMLDAATEAFDPDLDDHQRLGLYHDHAEEGTTDTGS